MPQPEDSVTLTGKIEIINDEETKRKILTKDYWQRISKRDSNIYCVFNFKAEEVSIYIDNQRMNICI